MWRDFWLFVVMVLVVYMILALMVFNGVFNLAMEWFQ